LTDVLVNDSFSADTEVDCLIIGGGAAGLTAALAASQDGAVVLVAERETRLAGSTALSSGLIPAAETNAQKRQNISDTKNTFYADIMEKMVTLLTLIMLIFALKILLLPLTGLKKSMEFHFIF